jgi:hypothetical protein
MISHHLESVDFTAFGRSCRRTKFVSSGRRADKKLEEVLTLRKSFWTLLQGLRYEEAGAEVD